MQWQEYEPIGLGRCPLRFNHWIGEELSYFNHSAGGDGRLGVRKSLSTNLPPETANIFIFQPGHSKHQRLVLPVCKTFLGHLGGKTELVHKRGPAGWGKSETANLPAPPTALFHVQNPRYCRLDVKGNQTKTTGCLILRHI